MDNYRLYLYFIRSGDKDFAKKIDIILTYFSKMIDKELIEWIGKNG